MRRSLTINGVPHFSRFVREVGISVAMTRFRLLSAVLVGVLILLAAGDDSAEQDQGYAVQWQAAREIITGNAEREKNQSQYGGHGNQAMQ